MASVREADGVWKIEANGRAIAIHSRDPQREADAAIGRLLDGHAPSLIVAIGLGLGYWLEALDRAGYQGRVLALEPEPATIDALARREVACAWQRDGRLRVLAAPTFAGASDCWALFEDGAAEPAIIVNPALARVHPKAVEAARELAARLRAEAASNAHARKAFAPRYVLNTLRNLPSIAAEGNVADLFDRTPAVPAIIVAAGPSLDQALAMLHDARQSALLICVDTALRPLLAAGIHPHVVVSIDPSEANARHLADIPPCANTVLVAEGSLDPLALAPFRGRTFFLNVSDHQPWPWIEVHGHAVGRLRAWGSVLTSAFDLALKMGCTPIAFAGADLAYTDDRPYCRGVVFEEDWRRREEWGTPIRQQWAEAIDRHPRVTENDVHGHPTRTAPHLVAFRNWLLEQMRAEPTRQFLNATGGGILHGNGITQIAGPALRVRLSSASVDSAIVFAHYRQRPNRLAAAAAALAEGLSTRAADAEGVLTAWEQFAPGLTRASVLPLLTSRPPMRSDRRTVSEPAAEVHAQVHMIQSWLKPWVDAVPLVPMRIPPHRITEWSRVGARIFFFRTMAARLIMCALQPPAGGLLEDGRALTEAASIDDVVVGAYRTCKDEVHFHASDGTDPRSNGREYVLMVPACVAELEGMPLHEVLARRL